MADLKFLKEQLQFVVRAGAHISEVLSEAKTIALEKDMRVRFEFNGIVFNIDKDSSIVILEFAFKEASLGDEIGP
jgi:hypothetical protein